MAAAAARRRASFLSGPTAGCCTGCAAMPGPPDRGHRAAASHGRSGRTWCARPSARAGSTRTWTPSTAPTGCGSPHAAADAVRAGLAVQPASLRAGGRGRVAPWAGAARTTPPSTSPPSAASARARRHARFEQLARADRVRCRPARAASSWTWSTPIRRAGLPEPCAAAPAARCRRARSSTSTWPGRASGSASSRGTAGGTAVTWAAAPGPARDRACDEIGWRDRPPRRGGPQDLAAIGRQLAAHPRRAHALAAVARPGARSRSRPVIRGQRWP